MSETIPSERHKIERVRRETRRRSVTIERIAELTPGMRRITFTGDLADFEAIMQAQGGRIFCLSARAKTPYTQIPFARGDALLFGAETRGLPAEVVEQGRHTLRHS